MLVLIGIVPGYFALNGAENVTALPATLVKMEQVLVTVDSTALSKPDRKTLDTMLYYVNDLKAHFAQITTAESIDKEKKFEVRKDIMVLDRNLRALMKKEEVRLSEVDKEKLTAGLVDLRKVTDYSPTWVLLFISCSLGIGTMIGWKRIVKTIGEKIGKEHLTYAQGASAEFVAASTIGLSSYLGMPVSTTHVLSSGIAGSMVASKGIKNLQADTVRNILIAWLLTVPVVVIMSGGLFLLFRAIF
jgi:PiT family inorganic phosphate transporter